VTAVDCPREADVLEAIAAQRWPHRVDDALQAHVAACPVCADVALMVPLFAAERESALLDAVVVPPSQVVWFRAQARARADAARQAARPIAIMQAVGLASAAAVISVFIGAIAWWVWTRTSWLQAIADVSLVPVDSMHIAIRGTLLAIALWLLLAPVAVYLVAADD
jgi:flagellar biosynthesis regulator FlaF